MSKYSFMTRVPGVSEVERTQFENLNHYDWVIPH